MDILQLSHYLDNLLNINGIKDSSRAVNGLQVENTGEIRKIGLAVDACQATIDMAIAQECNMMFVHHGLFWGGLMPVRGAHYQKLAAMLGANLGLYSAHVPLDMHPVLGNNRALADLIGLESLEPFGEYEGELIGLKGRVGGISAEALCERLQAGLGSPVRVIGEGVVNTVGVVTGGAGDMLKQAIDQRLDAYITGEGANHHFHEALEGGCVFLLAGHYATETGGVRAVGRHLKDKLDIESVFLDFPTGL
jgi:dinuclear metal center YbgI/SA1388 family protein